MITVYSDADGVLEAWTDHRSYPPPAAETGWNGQWDKVTIPGAFPGYVSKELVEAINRLAAHPGVTCKWLTSWEEEAPSQLAPAVGLDAEDWEVITGVDYDDPVNWNWWKLDRIRNDLEKDKPERVVWLDDDITSDPKSLEWLADAAVPVLHLSPKTGHGLTKADMEQVFKFVGA